MGASQAGGAAEALTDMAGAMQSNKKPLQSPSVDDNYDDDDII
jgi:hypothetical protein